MLQPTDQIDLFVWGLMGTDNSVAQEAEEEEIDGYQVFACGDFFPQLYFWGLPFICPIWEFLSPY